MRIVQSFWSKPLWNKNFLSTGGWQDKKTFLNSFILSAHSIRKYYDDLILYTDEFGYDLLVNKLKLPFTQVHLDLEKLNHHHESLWALGKIYTYALQEAPFIHLDFDFYITDTLPERLFTAPVCCYCNETSDHLYETVYKPPVDIIKKNFKFPDQKSRSFFFSNSHTAYNAGVMGGTELSIFKELYSECLRLIDNNSGFIKARMEERFNYVFEQYMLGYLTDKRNIKVECFFDHLNHVGKEAKTTLYYYPQTKYMHILGVTKRNRMLGCHLDDIIFNDYPEHYEIIAELMQKKIAV